ncbi:ATP synthase subunit delta [Jeotgalibaca dankookensis]|uniref:ATP synthase subunit delta n=1 Tax=Jeotgalibaca dankookensis TaxID=708126 RepID=A0A1S6IPJ0_9LACT|nr:F0F1 ATP synthase subunit delta [Jeotgalibaca dankookensis]AQS53467.1 ATP synthase subunit delta [Jeotgalibaca dankookensis]
MDKIEESLIDSYIDEFLDELEPENQSKIIKLTSAVPLRPEQKERIVTAFLNKINYTDEYEVIEVVDESVLGGVNLESDNFSYDNTLRNKLSQMKKHILQDQ